MGVEYQKGLILFHQSRWKEAADRFREEALDPANGRAARSMLALSLLNNDDVKGAKAVIDDALQQAPEHAHAHYVKAHVWLRESTKAKRLFSMHNPKKLLRKNIANAKESVLEAIRLDPFNAGFFDLLSGIYASRGDWPASLSAADEGLRFNPNHTGCANRRAVALKHLGLVDESDAELLRALSIQPHDAITHTNRGWLSLQEQDPDAADDHFRSALMQNPNSAAAQRGLKFTRFARYPFIGWLISLGLQAGVKGWTLIVLSAYWAVRLGIIFNDETFQLPPPVAIPLLIVLAIAVPILLLLARKYAHQLAQWRLRRKITPFNGPAR